MTVAVLMDKAVAASSSVSSSGRVDSETFKLSTPPQARAWERSSPVASTRVMRREHPVAVGRRRHPSDAGQASSVSALGQGQSRYPATPGDRVRCLAAVRPWPRAPPRVRTPVRLLLGDLSVPAHATRSSLDLEPRLWAPPENYASAMATCSDCGGSRAVPDIFGDLEACPCCVIDAGTTFVVWEQD